MKLPVLSRRALLGSVAAVVAGGGALTVLLSGRTTAKVAGPDLTGTPEAPVIIPAPPEPAGLTSDEVLEVWPIGRVPGQDSVTVTRQVLERGSPQAHNRAVIHVSQPILEVFRPAAANGAAMIILPGGGYARLAIDKEGAQVARRLTQDGITCFVLHYRLPADKWAAGYDVALQDAQRAVRLVRSKASGYGIDPRRIGVMGFSAGGHLAGALLTRHSEKLYESVDPAGAVSARPDLVMMGYPFIDLGKRPLKGIPPATAAAQPLNERVRPLLPPVFIVHAKDDKVVPVSNSQIMHDALKAASVPVEMHIYEQGGHGFGFGAPADPDAEPWPDTFTTWMKGIGFI